MLQYAGDNILAAFGSDEVREDDAERAVHCGLALLALGKTLGVEVLAAHGHVGFGVRVGVHTGGVLLGGGVDADGSIRGIAVNIAARMEQTAPAGALRISLDTYAQVRGLFEVESQAPLAVMGVDTPVQSYLVTRAKPRTFRILTRGIEGIATRMIGRDAEMALLQDAFLHLLQPAGASPGPCLGRGPELKVITVVAEAGLGKSRLLYEFESWAETRPERFLVFRGRATPHTQAQPFGLLRDIVAWHSQIADDDTVAVARAKLETGLSPLFVHDDGADLAQGHAHVLGHLIGIDGRDSRHVQGIVDDVRQIRSRGLHVATQLFRRLAASTGAPVVQELDDLHWADDESLDFLAQLAHANRDVAMLMLCFTRPNLFERRTQGLGLEGSPQRIALGPLDADLSQQLADELLKSLADVSDSLKRLIARRAEGNPFYMEELVKMLVDRGAIRVGPQRWTLDAERLLATRVPSTLTGVLQARLDGLPAAERLTLQEASVIGTVFWDRALMALDPGADQTLPALVRRDLTPARDAAAPEGLREYAFKHQVLHQVTYETLLKRKRRELHGKLAHWLSRLTGLRADEYLAATAEHYEQAGEAFNAAEFHTRAAEQACSRMAHDTSFRHVHRALALLDAMPSPMLGIADATADAAAATGTGADLPLRWRLLKVQESTLDLQGRRAEQRATLDALDAVAERLDDDRALADAAWRRAGMAMRTAQWAEQHSAAQRGAARAARCGDDALRLFGRRLEATALEELGDWRAAKALCEDALSQARALGLLRVQAYCLNSLGYTAAVHESDPTISLAYTQQSLQLTRDTGDRQREAIALSNMGQGWLMLGDFEQARRWLEEGLQLQRAHGDLAPQCNSLSNLSRLALWQGESERALDLARAAHDISRAVDGSDLGALALLCMGLAELARGQPGHAAQRLEEARQLVLGYGDSQSHELTAALAHLALLRGDLPAAVAQLQPVLGAAEAPTATLLQGLHRVLQLRCWQVLQQTGDARAGAWLQLMHGQLLADAAHVSDAALRQGFLHHIPCHREIVAAWRQREAAGVPPASPVD